MVSGLISVSRGVSQDVWSWIKSSVQIPQVLVATFLQYLRIAEVIVISDSVNLFPGGRVNDVDVPLVDNVKTVHLLVLVISEHPLQFLEECCVSWFLPILQLCPNSRCCSFNFLVNMRSALCLMQIVA